MIKIENKNLWGWALLLLMTTLWGLLQFYGINYHSDLDNPPTTFSRIISIVAFLICWGAIILSPKTKDYLKWINRSIILAGSPFLYLMFINLMFNLPRKNIIETGAIVGWGFAIFYAIALFFISKKLLYMFSEFRKLFQKERR